MATTPQAAQPTTAVDAPTIAAQLTGGHVWLIGTGIFSLMAYYFVGIDQGAISLFGNDLHIHELLHDARHYLGFPCH